jgi:hypothetical protein
MHKIDMQVWRDRSTSALPTPSTARTSTCANVDLTSFYPYVKGHGFSLTAAIIYVITLPTPFPSPLDADGVVEHETVIIGNDLRITICSARTIDYGPDFH